MSEFEKQQRDEYQKKRNRCIYIIMATAALLAILAFTFLTIYSMLNKATYVTYTQEGNVKWTAKLKENDKYEETVLGSNYEWAADLIDKVNAKFEYNLATDTEGVNYNYRYWVDADVRVINPKTEMIIFHTPYELLPQKTRVSQNGIFIQESLDIDFEKYNREARRLANNISDINTESVMVVTMHVETVGSSENFASEKKDMYMVELYIPLNLATVVPYSSSSVSMGEQKIPIMDTNIKRPYLIFTIVFGFLAIVALVVLVVFTVRTRDKHTNYAMRVKGIMSSYKSYIQRIQNSFDPSGYQILFVSKITELLEIRDALQMPILAYENDDRTCTRFLIATNTNVLYVFDVAVEEDEEPVLVEEPIVEAETVEVAEPEAEVEDTRIDVVDVVWPEHEGKTNERTYRYDPNGETVDVGDIVLVPSVDTFSSKEITRNAKVKRGNYKVDPSRLPYPLKKVICVIKRKS